MQVKTNPREIKAYCNRLGYTDVYPFEVVRTVSNITVEIRRMNTTLVKAPKNFHPGGFCGHYSDNHDQEYTYESNLDAPVIRVRWSEAKKQWQHAGSRFSMDDTPYKFHDYNF